MLGPAVGRAFQARREVGEPERVALQLSFVCDHQTLQASCLTIGAFALHENAFWNSGMFEIGPLTRYLFDE